MDLNDFLCHNLITHSETNHKKQAQIFLSLAFHKVEIFNLI